jgi:hypothetical protein
VQCIEIGGGKHGIKVGLSEGLLLNKYTVAPTWSDERALSTAYGHCRGRRDDPFHGYCSVNTLVECTRGGEAVADAG